MKKLFEKWNSISLVLRIFCGLVIGAILGLALPAGVAPISMLGTLFVGALKAVAPVLVFFLVISALCNAKGAGTMKSIVLMYIISTFCAALIAVIMSFIFPVEMVLVVPEESDLTSPQGLGEIITTLLTNVVANPVGSIVNANYLGILAWAVVIGLALRMATAGTKKVLADISDGITKVVAWIIAFAPFGVLGLVYDAVSTNGPEIFINYGSLLAVLVGTMLVVALVTNPIISFVCFRKNPYPLVFRTLKDSALTAFFTRSSAANIPVNMQLCQRLGLDKDAYSVSIPLGATINMAGAAITISVMAMAAAHTLGLQVDFPAAVVMCALAAVGACGVSGVPGGSLLLIPLACSLFGISNDIAMQVVGVGFIIGVIQDSCETALNSSSDVLLTASADYRKRMQLGIPFQPGHDAEQIVLSEYENKGAESAMATAAAADGGAGDTK